jgi:threonine dehydratase
MTLLTEAFLGSDTLPDDPFIQTEADTVAEAVWDKMQPLLPESDTELSRRFGLYVPQTPLYEVPSHALPTDLQNTRHRVFWQADGKVAGGSYKGRGMFSDLLRAELEAEQTGKPFTEVVVGSTGNHAGEAALVGTLLGKQVTVYMPENAVAAKVHNVEQFGGRVIFLADLAESLKAAEAHGQRPGARFVHPFDALNVIAGQGTAVFELREQLLVHGVDPDETLVERWVPAGGGGNLTGHAVAGERLLPGSPLRFAQSVGAAALLGEVNSEPFHARHFNASVDGAAVLNPGNHARTLARSKRYVEGGTAVTDGQVGEAMDVVRKFTNVYEPAGVLAMAAILAAMREDRDGKRVFEGHGSGINTTYDKVREFAAAGVAEGLLSTAQEFALTSHARLGLGRTANAIEQHVMDTAAEQRAAREAPRPVRTGTRIASGR